MKGDVSIKVDDRVVDPMKYELTYLYTVQWTGQFFMPIFNEFPLHQPSLFDGEDLF